MLLFVQLLLTVCWIVGWPLFAYATWDYQWPLVKAYDYAILAVDILIYLWILNDLLAWTRRRNA